MSQLLSESGPQAMKLLLAGAATGGVYLFGAWDIILKALIAMVVIDYITGVMAAYVEKSLNSEIGYEGHHQEGLHLFDGGRGQYPGHLHRPG